MSEANPSKNSASVWINSIAIFFTIVLISLSLYSLSQGEGCLPEASHFFERYIFCLEANALGDLFAGIFAPLSFIWVVVAVLLQGQELKAQREELAATRDVFEEQKRAMQDQANTAKKTANFMEEQVKMMRAENQDRMKERKQKEFNDLIENFCRHWNDMQGVFKHPEPLKQKNEFDSPINQDIYFIYYYPARFKDAENDFRKIFLSVVSSFRRTATNIEGNYTFHQFEADFDVSELISDLEKIEKLGNELGSLDLTLIKLAKVKEVIEILQGYLQIRKDQTSIKSSFKPSSNDLSG